MLVVMGDGRALVCDQASPPPRFELFPAGMSARDPRPMEVCAVFRFERNVVASARRAAVDPAESGSVHGSNGAERVVLLAPNALFRYYWRRRALEVFYPSPAEHVEEDALALLQHVVSRASPARQPGSPGGLSGRSRHRALAREAQQLMALTLAEPPQIAEIARTLGTSPFHLARVFRTEMGISPHQYLVQLRLNAALNQLRAGATDLSKVALELGFSHHSHFSAVFRQAIGYSPRDVRRMLTAECIADLGIAARQSS